MQCKQCKNQFEITDADRAFYKKMDVPEPTMCSSCRFQRRETFRNERTLYSRKCDKSGKPIISIFAPDSPFKVYAQDEWWKDDWDPPQADFYFNRPFFEQFRELQLQTPRLALLSKDSENTEFANHSARNKNCYIAFSTLDSEDIYYGMMINKCRTLTDCTYMYDGCELSYECFYGFKLYQCGWCLECRNSLDCWFCYDCVGCNNCFMSSNLRNKSYVFENKQLTREEYEKRIQQLFPFRYDTIERLKQQWLMVMDRAIHKYSNIVNSEDATGAYMLNCKFCHECVHTSNSENCAYMFHTWDMKDCWDVTNTLGELMYETHGIVGGYNNKFVNYSYDNRFVEYCDHIFNSENCFGCVGIKKGMYRILNKPYPKEEYLALKGKIIAHMKETGEYGEFFSSSLSPFTYNETIAQEIFPLTKEEARTRGLVWRDDLPGTRGKETKKLDELPATSTDVDEAITQEVLACLDCGKNYKIIKPELAFYKKIRVPLPRRCPDCRYHARLNNHNPKQFFHRQCTCSMQNHEHKGKCENYFVTKYKEGIAPQKVYCEQCYQKEIT